MHDWLLWATAAIWIAFIFYWSALASAAAEPSAPQAGRRPWISVRFKVERKPAPARDGSTCDGVGTRRESAGSRQVHQLLLWAALLIALLPGFAPLDRRWLPDVAGIDVAGLAVQFAFAFFYIWARRHLGRYWSGEIRTKADHQLIRTGPYRILRHPMYTGMIGMFLGTAMVSGQWRGLVGLAIGAMAYWRKIRLEERHLRESFGAAYEDYQRGSWALIPGLL